jgi:hypothetical protein
MAEITQAEGENSEVGEVIGDEAPDDDTVAHTNVMFDGNLPGPSGQVPSVLHEMSFETQRKLAKDLYDFLSEDEASKLELNADTLPRVALINIPLTQKVKVVYSIGFGSQGIGSKSKVANKFLFLSGDGGKDSGNPTPIVLGSHAGALRDVSIMTHEQFSERITEKGKNYTYPLLPRKSVENTEMIMMIAPIPAYLVYDGFTDDLDAADVYERLLSVDTSSNGMYDHAQHFLLACLSSHRIDDEKPFAPGIEFMTQVPEEARKWAKERFTTHFPTLQETLRPPTPTPTIPGIDPTIAALLERLLPAHTHRLPPTIEEEKKEEGKESSNMSDPELRETLKMCGLSDTGTISELPLWFQQTQEKGTSEQYKLTIIRKHIMSHTRYEDAEIPLTAPLLKMALKRNWTGKDGNIKRPSLLHAADGISPFLVLDLDEDEVATINEDAEAMQSASYITFEDIKSFKKKIQAKVPETAEDFALLLKRYANLLFALFSEHCSLFKCVIKIIDALKDFSKAAKEGMTKRTRASILWIILLQARQFAIGEMNILVEFTTMHTNLSAKMGAITHAEVPTELYEKKQKPPKRDSPDKPDNDIKKKPRQANPNNWHPKLKANISKAMATAKNPSFQSIMKFCGKNADELYPKYGKRCTPNSVLGHCYMGDKCTRQHVIATDGEAEEILTLLKPFLDNPAGMLQG